VIRLIQQNYGEFDFNWAQFIANIVIVSVESPVVSAIRILLIAIKQQILVKNNSAFLLI